VVWCGADWNLRQLDARLLFAPAKLGAGCSLMALAGLAAVLAWSEIVRAYGGLPNAYGGLPAAREKKENFLTGAHRSHLAENSELSLRLHHRIKGKKNKTARNPKKEGATYYHGPWSGHRVLVGTR
jgi:hypothetical protein